MKEKRIKIVSAFVTVAIVSALIIYLFSGENKYIFNSLISGVSAEELKGLLQQLGNKGAITISAFSALQVIIAFLPAEPAQILAGVSYGFFNGFLICLIGVIIGNTVIFIAYKIFGDKLKDYFSKNVNLDFKKLVNSPKAVAFIFLLYFLPAIPYGLICFIAATFSPKYLKYIIITVLGSIPSIVIGVGLGHITATQSWIISVTVFAILVVGIILLFANKKRIFDAVNKKIDEKRQNEYTVKKPNAFLCFIVGRVFRLILKLKVKITYKNEAEKIEGPAIIIGNHGSFVDFLYTGYVLEKVKPHVVTNRMYFQNPVLKYLLKSVGAIPKSMFSTDIECVRNCLKVINNGKVLMLFPEARLSTVGKYEGIQPVTLKFIRKMNVNVYLLKSHGDFLAKPKWGDKLRKKSVVELKLTKLFNKGEPLTLSESDFAKKIDEAMDYNEFSWLDENKDINYPHKTLAVGLENILTVCPKCGARYSLESNLNTLSCSSCGEKWEIDDRYGFKNCKFKNFQEWYYSEEEELYKEIKSNPDYTLSSEVKLKHLSNGKKSLTVNSGEGKCTLTKEGLRYEGTENGKFINKLFTLSEFYRLLFGAAEDFEVYEEKELYYFIPTELKSCVTWYMVSGIIKKIYDGGNEDIV